MPRIAASNSPSVFAYIIRTVGPGDKLMGAMPWFSVGRVFFGSVKKTLRIGPTGQWEYGETKRAENRRIIRLQNWVLAKLKDLKQRQTESPLVDPEEWPEAVDLIFVTEFGRPVNVNRLVYKHFKPILKRAVCRIYDFMICGILLRHWR
jgi:hypothetical protein